MTESKFKLGTKVSGLAYSTMKDYKFINQILTALKEPGPCFLV